MASKPNPTQENGVDIDAVRQRLLAYKAETKSSWADLSSLTGVPDSTLSLFSSNKYTGNNANIAATVARWFDARAHREVLYEAAPVEVPGFLPTPTAKRLITLLRWAQRGKIVVVAASPGTGKSSAALQYAADTPQVWVATMSPSTRGVNTMLVEILKSMREQDPKGSPQMLAQRIRERVKGTNGVIIVDEAQHLSEQALEELRAIHDATGIGIALFGNEQVLARLEGGNRRAAFAQLFSRVSMRHIQNIALPEDAAVLAAAWKVSDAQELAFLKAISAKPGGLRGMTMTLELGSILAAGDAMPLSLAHLRDAWAQLSTRPLGAH